MKNKWTSVKKRSPKSRQRVWCAFYDLNDKAKFTFTDALIWWRDKGGVGHWTRTDCSPLERRLVVTHWFELPPNPDAK